jgi:DNA-binding GntR family transcriptional regulator
MKVSATDAAAEFASRGHDTGTREAAADRISRPSLHAEVAERVRARIFDATLAAGQRIDEVALADELGISRTPLREALKVLASEGLVRLEPGKGAFVTALSARDVDELFPVMGMLEGRCAHEAVRKMSTGDRARLDELHRQLEDAAASGDADGYYAVNYEFHRSVEALAGNPWLVRITSELRRFMRLSRGRQLQVPGRLQASLREHRAFMRAVHAGDAQAAQRLMNEHLLAQQRAWRQLHAGDFAGPAPDAANATKAPKDD